MTNPFHRRLLLIAASLAVAACAQPPAPAPTAPANAPDFEATIARLEKADPGSPETLNARLEYADFLAGTSATDCVRQLAAAEAQLDIVAANPAIAMVLPLAPAEIASAEYKLHLARATCGRQAPPASELQQALAAARRAVGLYQDAFDYPSAAVMQFNLAATYQQLGDAEDALSALQAAIALDRDYGLRSDAEDDTRLLLQWQDRKADDSAVAAAMKDFPVAPPARFTFHWGDSDADVAVAVDITSVIHGQTIMSHGATRLARHVRADKNGWSVSNAPAAAPSYDLGEWPADAEVAEWSMLYFLGAALLEKPDIRIDGQGAFQGLANGADFASHLAKEIFGEIASRVRGASGEKLLPAGAIALALSPDFSSAGQAVIKTLNPAFSPDAIETEAGQDYGLETATWIGASLEQGVWYKMSAPLLLPGLGLGLYAAEHDVSFAFTRELPCAPSSERRCVELVLHATPDPGDLKKAFAEAGRDLELPDTQSADYRPRIDLRLVIDPATLQLYLGDIRQSWYDRVGKSDPILEQVRVVSTYTYK